ncbi:MalY/PatB family protein [Microbacterium karelineae]|uniref:MalY/PatB family protein n=1 Tax=Microbacterium karelineae TaxID=2654283 RepID=UPI0012EA1147|nr:aminotransferase class I/II-fold pyridoxal phosphate-dependent enzyme [Microbacterium karelineae]
MSASSRPTWHRKKWDIAPGKIGAWVAETDYGTSPAVRSALHRAVDEGFLTYLPTSLAREAEGACADYLATALGWTVPPPWVHLVPDVLTALRLTITHFTRPESAVVVPTPAYMPFLTVPRGLGRDIIQIPAVRSADGRSTIDLVALDAAFAAGGGLLVLCDPHNPLGQVLTEEETQGIAEIVDRHGGQVFSDAIHSPIVFGPDRYRPYAAHSVTTAAHTVSAIATSKGWNLPGLKTAQLILSNSRDQERWEAQDPWPAEDGSILGAVAAIAAYRDSADWLADMVERLDGNRRLLRDLLTEHVPLAEFRMPDATYLAWVDFSAYALADSPARVLADVAHVVTTDGAECGRGFEHHIRLNFAMEPETLDEAIRRIGRAAAEAAPFAASTFPRRPER